jgi:hypothetical protein
MEKIDRLGWADGFTFSCFGVPIGIRANQRDFCQSLRSVLPPGHRPLSSSTVQRLYSLVVGGSHQERGVRHLNILYDGAQRLCRERELSPVLKILEAQIRRAVAEMAPRRVFVHAGVIEHRGRAIVIPGPSMSGKSTLVSELIKLGATYYSDEYAVLDDKGMVSPFAKPISLRVPGTYNATDYDIAHFGATVGVKSVPIGLVAITRYAEGAKWRPRRLSPGQGALAMLSHSVAARRQPRRVMVAINRALEKAEVIKGVRGEASEVAQQMLEALGRTFDASSEDGSFMGIQQT